METTLSELRCILQSTEPYYSLLFKSVIQYTGKNASVIDALQEMFVTAVVF